MFVWSSVVSLVSEGGMIESSRIIFFFKRNNGGVEYVKEEKDRRNFKLSQKA